MGQQVVGQAPERLGLWSALSFSAAGLPIATLDVTLLLYLPPHLTGDLGIPLAVVGLCWAVVRLLDIVIDPVLGVAMDATRTRFGRYRLWMILGAPVLMAGAWGLCFAKPGVSVAALVGWLVALYLGRSILHLAHPAWAATIARTYNARARLFGVMAAVGVAGTLAVLSVPVINARLHGPDSGNVALMGGLVILLTPLSVGLAVWRTGERLNPGAPGDRPQLSDYLALLTKPDLVRLYLSIGALTFGPGAMAALYIFFMRDHSGFTVSQATILLGVFTLGSLIGAPSIARLATGIGKHRALMVCAAGFSLGLITLQFTPRASIAGTAPTLLWCGFMAAGFELMIRAMLADVADQVRLEQGRERLSSIYALNTLVTKVAAAAAVAITYPLLQRIGYSPAPGAHNTPEAISGLGAIFLAGPIVFVLVGAACVAGWKLTAARHAVIRAELDLRDAEIAGMIALGDA